MTTDVKRTDYTTGWGELIKRRRSLIGDLTGQELSQAELARRLDVTPVTVWRWEDGRAAPGPRQQAGLIRELRITGDELRELIVKAADAA